MRPSGDPDWCEYRCVVPLTGREPVLERVRERLRVRGPGWGWMTITGPRGAGTTRVLDEIEELLEAQGEPAALRIRPVGDAAVPMEPLRRALRPLFPQLGARALERALAAVLPIAPDDLGVLATWLLGGEGAWRDASLQRDLVRALVERVAAGGPVLLDSAEQLDDDSLDVLLLGAQCGGPGVIATVLDSSALASGGEVLTLEPLGASQIELLLTRWLRNAATARRLTPLLLERCGGWPGRVVEAVRALARESVLRADRRGVVVAGDPLRAPDGRSRSGSFGAWLRTQAGRIRRLAELASVQGAPDDPALLGAAAGVPAAVAAAVVAEACASRGGLEPGLLFATAKAREEHRRSLTPARRRRLAACLAQAWEERARGPSTAGERFARLRSYARAQRDDLLADALASTLADCAEPRRLPSHALNTLAEAAARLAQAASPAADASLGATLDCLWRAGRREETAHIVDAWRPANGPQTSLEALARARQAIHRGRPFDAEALLEEHLSALAPGASPAAATDGWLLLARLRGIGRKLGAARDALRCAGRSLPAGDLRRRAMWHGALGATARAAERPRGVRAHLVRAAFLHVAAGQWTRAADALRELGTCEVEAGRVADGLAALERAARLHCFLGDREGRARSLHQIGSVLVRRAAFEQAIHHLQEALRAAEACRDAELLPRLHLALARAHHGCGDLVHERHHAELAASLASDALDRVRAAMVLARADLRAGQPAAERLLEACVRDLRVAGLAEEAGRAQAALVDARLRAGASPAASRGLHPDVAGPHASLAAARLALATGRPGEARRLLEALAADGTVPVELRASALGYLAEAHTRTGRMRMAREAAISSAALLEVAHRSRADDARLHRILARVFRALGDHGRAVSHRRAARRCIRTLVRVEGDARARRRLVRAIWRRDPRPVDPLLKAAS